ncbi:TPA: hypothetical protein NR353_001605 [Legionella pneumophila]|jgi:3-oxoacyl-[acyl-carrier-protein] synthase III|uniref:3-oxoacyl-ACP synthase n=1 Tax=Legionella waltersii TaxID=66969 RepID=A0A0W1AGD5_9GAMM|nr:MULTISPECIES: 3-oxoacyl-[acyl-carrier-protein] synthase III C-terminal domain-containing protein [Legionella]KTD80437.1 3-oxoacyl-ACP synthase [Legionella waltersii]MBN5936065.1 hypothetical protein [Legionella anisa]SNV10012.1 3-oxoacyl-ACP synthase [Legionella waltersii]HAT1130433.1 3-oxoacyl-ACP reductase [Legionella pneumophila]HAT1919943.1 3-oxoacyl-ACP reductase [Legionella pneumophila]
MKINSVQLSLPSRTVSNEDILQLIADESTETAEKEKQRILAHVSKILKMAGANNRYWRAEDELPIQMVTDAFNKGLVETGWQKKDIDLLIYVGVGKGFIEPGNSYMIAHALKLDHTHCFDILDACMSWVRAVHLAHNYFKLGNYKRIIIVNAEFNIKEYFYPALFKLSAVQQLQYTFPAFTVGEGASVTFLSNEDSEPWEFQFSSRTDLADLCTIPFPNYESFCDNSTNKIGKNGAYRFTSYGFDLHKHGYIEGINIIRKLSIDSNAIDILLPHASTKNSWQMGAEAVGLGDKLFCIFPETGNLVSASVPAGMFMALNAHKLKRGDRVISCVGSAGMSFAAFSFIF